MSDGELKNGGAATMELGDNSPEYLVNGPGLRRDSIFLSSEEFNKYYEEYTKEQEEKDPARNLSNRVFALTEEQAVKSGETKAREYAYNKFFDDHGRRPNEKERLEIESQLEKNGIVKSWAQKLDITESEIDEFEKKYGRKPTEREQEEKRKAKINILFHEFYEKYLSVHWQKGRKKTDLDGKCALGLFQWISGFNINFKEDVHYIRPGTIEEGRVMVDTSAKGGPRAGVSSNYRVNNETNTVEWDTTTIIDHHDPESEINTSATRWVYKALSRAGLIDKSQYLDVDGNYYLDNLVQFVTDMDNYTFPDQEKYFDSGDRRLVGLWKFATWVGLNKFFKDKRDPTEILSDDDLKKYGFIFSKTKNGRPVTGKDGQPEIVNFQKKQSLIIEKSKEQIKTAEEEGFTISSSGHFGKIYINVSGLAGGYEAIRAAGYDTYIVWMPKHNYFFLSCKDGFPTDFNPGDGDKVRKRMWMAEEDREEPLRISLLELLKKMVGDEFNPSGKLLERIENERKGIFEDEPDSEAGEMEEAEAEGGEPGEPEPETMLEKYTTPEMIAGSFKKGIVWTPINNPTEPYQIEKEIAEDGLAKDEVAIKKIFPPDSPVENIKISELVEQMACGPYFTLETDDERKQYLNAYKNWVEKNIKTEAKPKAEEINIAESFAVGSRWVAGGGKYYVFARIYIDDKAEKVGETVVFQPKEEEKYEVIHSFGEADVDNDEVVVKNVSSDEKYIVKAKDLILVCRPDSATSLSDDEKVHLKTKFNAWLYKNNKAGRFLPPKEENPIIKKRIEHFRNLDDEGIEETFKPGTIWVTTGEMVKADIYYEDKKRSGPTKFNYKEIAGKEFKIIGAFENSSSGNPDDVTVEYESKNGKKIRFDIAILDFLEAFKPKDLLYIKNEELRNEISEKYDKWAIAKLNRIDEPKTELAEKSSGEAAKETPLEADAADSSKSKEGTESATSSEKSPLSGSSVKPIKPESPSDDEKEKMVRAQVKKWKKEEGENRFPRIVDELELEYHNHKILIYPNQVWNRGKQFNPAIVTIESISEVDNDTYQIKYKESSSPEPPERFLGLSEQFIRYKRQKQLEKWDEVEEPEPVSKEQTDWNKEMEGRDEKVLDNFNLLLSKAEHITLEPKQIWTFGPFRKQYEIEEIIQRKDGLIKVNLTPRNGEGASLGNIFEPPQSYVALFAQAKEYTERVIANDRINNDESENADTGSNTEVKTLGSADRYDSLNPGEVPERNFNAIFEDGILKIKSNGREIEIGPGSKRKWIGARDNQDVGYTVESIAEEHFNTQNPELTIKFAENPKPRTRTIEDWGRFFANSFEA